MQSKHMFFRVGLWVVLTASPALATAAGESGGVVDNYLVLGVVAALLVFAFTRRGSKPAPRQVSAPEPAASESEQPTAASTAESEESAEASSEEIEQSAEAQVAEGEEPAEKPPGSTERTA